MFILASPSETLFDIKKTPQYKAVPGKGQEYRSDREARGHTSRGAFETRLLPKYSPEK
jgi:hypothetical protein